jgi:DNA-binding transcriptional LysR family regulator
MKTSLDDLRLLCRIVETGSLRAAAEEIGADPSSVTRRLVAMEQRLGVKLITRSRVRSRPTDAGMSYYREVKVLLERFDALEGEVAGTAAEARGVLRIAAPTIFGARHVAPWLHELQLQAPKLEIELMLTDRPLDLVEHGLDVAVTIGSLRNSSLIATRLGTMLTAIVAAPGYLSRAGTPAKPEDLAHYDFVLHAGPLQGKTLSLNGARNRTVSIACRTRFTASTILGVMEAVIAGAGLCTGPQWLFADAIARGDLVHVLPKWSPPKGAVHALTLPGDFRPAKTKLALAMLRTRVPNLRGIVG